MTRRCAVFVLILVLFFASLGGAQSGATEFEVSGSYQLAVEGSLDLKARMFVSESPRGVLVISDRLSAPLLLLPGSGNVQEVPLMRLVPRDNGNVGLLRGEELQTLGRFEVADGGIAFSQGDLSLLLQEKQPLVGLTNLESLFAHSPEYRGKADSFVPDAGTIANLKKVGEGYSVYVVFGSWCHVCKNFLPKGLKVEEALEGSNIEFEYYGLPKGPWSPPHDEVRRNKVKSLPTAIVYKDGKEIGRFAGGEQWVRPEARIYLAIEEAQ